MLSYATSSCSHSPRGRERGAGCAHRRADSRTAGDPALLGRERRSTGGAPSIVVRDPVAHRPHPPRPGPARPGPRLGDRRARRRGAATWKPCCACASSRLGSRRATRAQLIAAAAGRGPASCASRPCRRSEAPRRAAACTPSRRDRAAISHHYDISNAFYERCSARRWSTRARTSRPPDDTLEAAQTRKLDLICRKLELRAGRAAARHRLRLGLAADPRGASTTACAASA